MKDCIFCKIVRGEIPKEFDFENEDLVAFSDIHPQAPVHLLIIPKKHIPDFSDADAKTFLQISKAIQELVKKTGLLKKGYKIAVNGGGAQDIFHLHFHLLGPKKPGLKI